MTQPAYKAMPAVTFYNKLSSNMSDVLEERPSTSQQWFAESTHPACLCTRKHYLIGEGKQSYQVIPLQLSVISGSLQAAGLMSVPLDAHLACMGTGTHTRQPYRIFMQPTPSFGSFIEYAAFPPASMPQLSYC